MAFGLAFLVGTEASSQGPVPLAPGKTLFQLDLSGTPIGEFPKSVRQLSGQMTVVSLGGKLMLKATANSEFLVTLPQLLPADFTIEFDIVPKAGGPQQDLSFEGTSKIDQGTGSAHILWNATGELVVVGGGGEGYDSPMPDELKATLPGVLTHVVADFQGNTVKLYTNGRRHYTLNKNFTRGRYLRVFLGGQDDATLAVHRGRGGNSGEQAAGRHSSRGHGEQGTREVPRPGWYLDRRPAGAGLDTVWTEHHARWNFRHGQDGNDRPRREVAAVPRREWLHREPLKER
jgi:hypothetical protein